MTKRSSSLALEIRGLAKTFERPAVDGLDLAVRAGEFYTLLGPNGAGKTTTLRMATGLLKPDRGSISVFDIDVLSDPVAAKQIMAWLSDEPMIYDRLTPLEYLYFVAGLWGVAGETAEARASDLIAWLGLAIHANAQIGAREHCRNGCRRRPLGRPAGEIDQTVVFGQRKRDGPRQFSRPRRLLGHDGPRVSAVSSDARKIDGPTAGNVTCTGSEPITVRPPRSFCM